MWRLFLRKGTGPLKNSRADSVASLLSVRPAPKRQVPAPRKLHAYFVAFTLIFGLLVLVGFARTFFAPVFRGTFSRPLIVHVHGALFFGWTLLLVVQASLAATKRLGLHRAIGSASRLADPSDARAWDHRGGGGLGA